MVHGNFKVVWDYMISIFSSYFSDMLRSVVHSTGHLQFYKTKMTTTITLNASSVSYFSSLFIVIVSEMLVMGGPAGNCQVQCPL